MPKTYKQLENELRWSKKQTAYAWAKFYEQLEIQYDRELVIFNDFKETAEEEDGISLHLQALINKLVDKAKEKIECSICMTVINKDTLKTGKCGHNFHESCIATWLATEDAKGKCPVCRKKF